MAMVTWIQCQNGNWCPFSNVDPSRVNVEGVYAVGYAIRDGLVSTVYVGQGDIAARIQKHRNDPDITYYASRSPLLVTWATVPSDELDGVERFVADSLHPYVGSGHPDVPPIPVNLPVGWS